MRRDEHIGIKAIILILTLAVISACSKSVPFQSSEIVPAAEAKVMIDQDQNDNYELEINIENLAKPGSLHPPRETYVVWCETTENDLNKLGQIKINNNLKGTLKTTIPSEPLRIFITAEKRADVNYPDNKVILQTRRSN